MSFGREIEKIDFGIKYCQWEHALWSLRSSVLTPAHLLPDLSVPEHSHIDNVLHPVSKFHNPLNSSCQEKTGSARH